MARETRSSNRATVTPPSIDRTRKSQRLMATQAPTLGKFSGISSTSSSPFSFSPSPSSPSTIGSLSSSSSFSSSFSFSIESPDSPCANIKQVLSKAQGYSEDGMRTSTYPAKRIRQTASDSEQALHHQMVDHTPRYNQQSPSAIVTTTSYLAKLSIEVQQRIAIFLKTDDDVKNYMATCKSMNNCITDSVWRARFLCVYDELKSADVTRYLIKSMQRSDSKWCSQFLRKYDQLFGAELVDKLQTLYVQQYKFRQTLSMRSISFKDRFRSEHEDCLFMLQGMILESDAKKVSNDDCAEEVLGCNHSFFRNYFNRSRRSGSLIDVICQTDRIFNHKTQKFQPMVLVLQLCFIHLVLHPSSCNELPSGFHNSQEQVYKCPKDSPLFIFEKDRNGNKQHKHMTAGVKVNFEWLLHCANFFKFHLKKADGEGILSHMYQQLDESEMPRPWTGKLKTGTQRLGKHWKGAFTFLEEKELRQFRTANTGEQIDETSEGNNSFQDVTLFFDIENQPLLHFPPAMEALIHSKEAVPFTYLDTDTKLEVTPEVKYFFGLGFDGSQYHLYGRLHSLPPQQGIPGFQRVTMMKCLPDADGKYGVDQTALWAYEGCILPGNEIILGRWWNPDGISDYSGPFLFWGIPGTAEDKIKDLETALKFLEVVDVATEWPS